jgi:endonuclease/exonuclease/phosphatase family metal-dependent hydrolase
MLRTPIYALFSMNRNLRKWLVLLLVLPTWVVYGLQKTPGIPVYIAEVARFVPYYWLLPLAILALLLVWGLRMWVAAITVLNLVILLTQTMGVNWNVPLEATVSGESIRVLTYNTKVHQLLNRPGGIALLADEIRLYNADVIALQDADGWLLDIATTVPTRMPVFLGYPEAYAMGQYIIASRFPIEGCTANALGQNARSRNYMHCRLSVHGKPLNVVTAHLLSPRYAFLEARTDPVDGAANWTANLTERLTQSQVLAQSMIQLPRPLLVMGDFNAREESPVMEKIMSIGLSDAFSMAGSGWGFTYGHSIHRHIDFLRIDHILVSPEFQVTNVRVGESRASDHRAVIADLHID